MPYPSLLPACASALALTPEIGGRENGFLPGSDVPGYLHPQPEPNATGCKPGCVVPLRSTGSGSRENCFLNAQPHVGLFEPCGPSQMQIPARPTPIPRAGSDENPLSYQNYTRPFDAREHIPT